MMTRLFALLVALATPLVGCGGTQDRMDEERIRQNADQADKDLDRESAQHEE